MMSGANHVWCATMALNGIIGAGVPQDWATHMIGHELTALFGIDHGQSLAIVLPWLLEVQRKQKHAKLLQYAERVWGIDGVGEEEKITLAIERTKDFFERLGVKTKLSDYGVGAEKDTRSRRTAEKPRHGRAFRNRGYNPGS